MISYQLYFSCTEDKQHLLHDEGLTYFYSLHGLYHTSAGSRMSIISSRTSSSSSFSARSSSWTMNSSVRLTSRGRHRRLATSISWMQSLPSISFSSPVYRYSRSARNVSQVMPGNRTYNKKIPVYRCSWNVSQVMPGNRTYNKKDTMMFLK